MNHYPYQGYYQGRRSGTGGCGCGSRSNPSRLRYVQSVAYPSTYQMPYQASYQPSNQLVYQPLNQSVYQSVQQPLYQPVQQPLNQPVQQPVYQPLHSDVNRSSQPASNPTPSLELLKLLEEVMAGEAENQMFYEQLLKLAPTSVDREIISGIREDETTNNHQFHMLYLQFTGQDYQPQAEPVSEQQPLSYMANLRKVLFGEMDAVKKYRMIRSELSSEKDKDTLFNMITDKWTHMGKFNYLITINKKS